MIEKNIIILVGDLGSGVNFLKNLFLLSDQSHWPAQQTSSRLDYLLDNIYPAQLKDNLSNWMRHEYKLRTWSRNYGADISDCYADISTALINDISQTNKICFISHWPNIVKKLKIQYSDICCVGLYPQTKFGLLWQIKTYIDKVGIENLQNFSFNDNIEENKQQHIAEYGIDHYYKTNVSNMVEIMGNRVVDYKEISNCSVCIEDLIGDDISDIIANINKLTECNIDLKLAQRLHNAWKSLHQSQKQVNDCQWFEFVNNF
jgi:hypothetical protein